MGTLLAIYGFLTLQNLSRQNNFGVNGFISPTVKFLLEDFSKPMFPYFIQGAVVEPSSHLAKNPTYSSRTRTWDLTTSPSTTITKYHCTLTSGPWSISPNGLQLCCLATKHGIEEEEDLFLSKLGTSPQKCTPCNIPGGMSEYRRIYPQGCPFSHDGSVVACIRVVGGALHLSITNARNAKTLCSEKVSKVCPGFRGVVVDCAFSPNGRYLAVTSSHGHVYFLTSARLALMNSLENSKILAPYKVPDLVDSNLEDFITQSVCKFDPRFPFQEFATCVMYAGVVKTWNMSTNDIKDTDIQNKHTLMFKKLLNVVRYSPDGTILAVGSNDGTISCVNTEDGTISFVLDASQQPPEFHSEGGVFHLAFTQSGEELAGSYSDGYIRIWQLPMIFDLKLLCRQVINACVPPSKIQRLPLPSRLKDFLLHKHF